MTDIISLSAAHNAWQELAESIPASDHPTRALYCSASVALFFAFFYGI